ncbi:MAG: ABC transporter substrate-binding protein [Desulfopila sp.]
MKVLHVLLAVWMSCALAGCRQAEEPHPPPDRVVLQLKWVHQAQFAGFYMAQDQGLYAAENLEVRFLEGGSEVDQARRLRNGTAQFAVVPAEAVLLDNARRQRLVAVSVLYQRNPTMFVARHGSGIVRPRDMQGKKVAVGDMDGGGFIEGIVQLQALFRQMDLDYNSLVIRPYDPLHRDFISKEVDITPAYLVGGITKLRRQGMELNLIWPGDYGIDFYSDTLATTAEYLDKHPAIALRFLRATLKGWRRCIENQKRCVDSTMAHARVKDRGLQQEMMHNQVALVNTGEDPIGWMQGEVWQKMYAMLMEQGLVTTPLDDIHSVYTMRFLQDIHAGSGDEN